MIKRQLYRQIEKKYHKGKAIVLVGPRQVGKTTLIKKILEDKTYLFLDGDDLTIRTLLENTNTEQLRSIIGDFKFVFIDEAQRIPNIDLTLKIITDQFKEVQLLVSGSSAFELKNLTNEPLTGRKFQFNLLPISWKEFEDNITFVKATQQLEQRILYGMYPDIINNLGDEVELLTNLADSYLYKDILSFHNIKKPETLEKLVQALAYQIGQEVSFNELSRLLGVDKNTVSTYIDILENNYVIFRLQSFSKNLRTEIKRNQKIYFYDLGIRNAVIKDFKPLAMRQDKGMLWENFLIVERLKTNLYNKSFAKTYFWRTTRQQEVDYIETLYDSIKAFEFKWNRKQKVKIPKTFENTYNVKVEIVDSGNFRSFIYK
ncbi:ATP-binding protein [Polaribacter porphyrae]|uniref:ATPase n=1 Tax=Polaribacter porphyrae TaxID=1137780 RepID=A0A2S7WS93_9FLAO|nr:ATP-binding protein [Polaribacter porphyrae]PQJ80467.1 ATPase [Polaribacter porphyrae]